MNALVNRFEAAAKMMKTVAKGQMPQVPGMGPIPGAKFGGSKKVQPKKGSKSGNPAKRAADNAALGRAVSPAAGASGAGFGVAGAKTGPTEQELASLQKLLNRG